MARFLADTSAWTRHTNAAVTERWATLIELDELALCPPVRLELLYSARGGSDYLSRSGELDGFEQFPLTELDAARAAATQARLAASGQHRGPKPIDLLVAAIAERHDAVVLHYDKHFDTIARATGQPTEWIARRGSLD